MMTNIQITPNADEVQLEFKFQSLDEFSYKFEIVNCDTGDRHMTGQGSWNGQTLFILGKGSDLLGLCLNIAWGELDPTGGTGDFSATATASQNGNVCQVVQSFTGKSTGNIVNGLTQAKFIKTQPA